MKNCVWMEGETGVRLCAWISALVSPKSECERWRGVFRMMIEEKIDEKDECANERNANRTICKRRNCVEMKNLSVKERCKRAENYVWMKWEMSEGVRVALSYVCFSLERKKEMRTTSLEVWGVEQIVGCASALHTGKLLLLIYSYWSMLKCSFSFINSYEK